MFPFRWDQIYHPLISKLNDATHFDESALLEFAVVSADFMDEEK